MRRNRPIRFDDAFLAAKRILEEAATKVEGRLLLIRDVQGRMVVLSEEPATSESKAVAEQLEAALGAYGGPADEIWLSPEDVFDAKRLFKSEDTQRLFMPSVEDGPEQVWLLERTITGQDWVRAPLKASANTITSEVPRLAFFGLKGGVGRSTALILLARSLAQAGFRVLVVDLDLEAPGLGPLLAPLERTPDFGIVDYLVEQAVGQADDAMLDDMTLTSPLVTKGAGHIRVLPAAGRKGDYLAKLGRVYQPAEVGQVVVELAERVDDLIGRLVAKEPTDVVLLDSRAGLHDLAAFAVTRLRAQTLLFATNSPHTWADYRLLFEKWKRHPALDDLRQNLKMVSALIPETQREPYLKKFIEQSHTLFTETLYEEDPNTEEVNPNLFNFDLNDNSAPHYPVKLYWNRALQEFDPIHSPDAVPEDQLQAATGNFCQEVRELLELESSS